jgi:hypothetical protein
VRETLERYRERLGMDLLVARLEVPGVPEAAAEGSLDRLVGDVLPGLGSPLSPPPPLG